MKAGHTDRTTLLLWCSAAPYWTLRALQADLYPKIFILFYFLMNLIHVLVSVWFYHFFFWSEMTEKVLFFLKFWIPVVWPKSLLYMTSNGTVKASSHSVSVLFLCSEFLFSLWADGAARSITHLLKSSLSLSSSSSSGLSDQWLFFISVWGKVALV